jgi:hypothetical protein
LPVVVFWKNIVKFMAVATPGGIYETHDPHLFLFNLRRFHD